MISLTISCSESDKSNKHQNHIEKHDHSDHDSEEHSGKHEKDHSDESHDKDHADKDSHDEESHKKEEDSEHDESDEHGHHGESKFGKGKAVTKADENKGIQLADHTIDLLKIKTKPLGKYKTGENTYKLPKSSLVYFENQVGVYYRRDNWYNLHNVKIRSKHHNLVSITAKTLKATDKLVTSGAPLLRLAHLEAFGASGEGHGH